MQVAPAVKKWTVLVWSASDNDLYAYQVADLDEAERVGCADTFQMVAQLDHRLNPDPAGPHTVQRLELQPDPAPGLHSPVRQDLGDLSMARPEALSDFIQWGMERYPAEHYWLVVSDHGEAWKGACQDDGSNDWMSLPELQQALQTAREKTGRKLDVVSFDACYMGSLEVAHQLRREADFMVGSEEMVGYYGLPYDQLLADMNQTPRQLVERIVELGKGDGQEFATSAAVDLGRVGAVTDSVRELGQAILATRQDLKGTLEATQAFWQYRDVSHLAQQIEQRSGSDEELRQAAVKVQQTLRQAVVAEQHDPSHPDAYGLQLEVDPDAARAADGWEYEQVAFAADTGWAEAARKLRS